MGKFNLEKARESGKTDEQILNYLVARYPKFNVDRARARGKKDPEILEYLSSFEQPLQIEKPQKKLAPAWAIDRPNLYGAFGGAKSLYQDVVKPTAEGAGMYGGAAAGGVPGAALGYGIVKKGTEFVDRQIAKLEGEDKGGRTVPQELLASLNDVKTGLIMEMGGRAAPAAIGGALEKTVMRSPINKHITPETKELMGAVKKHGMELSPVDATQSKTLGLIEALLEKMPGSTDVIRDWRMTKQLEPMLKTLQAMRDKGAAQKDISELGREIYESVDDFLRTEKMLKGDKLNAMRTEILARLGTKETFSTLGLEGKELLKARTILANEKGRRLYKGVDKFLPKGAEYDTPELQKAAKKLLKEYSKLPPKSTELMRNVKWAAKVDDAAPKEVMDQLNALPKEVKEQFMNENPEMFGKAGKQWATLQNFRRDVAALANKEDALKQTMPGMKFQTTPEGRAFTILKKAAERDMEVIAKKSGGKAWARFQASQAFWGKKSAVFKSREIRKLAKSNPEDLIDAGFVPNGITEVQLMKKALGPDGFLKLREGFTNKLLGVGKHDTFDPKVLRQNLMRYGDETLGEVFEKSTVKELKDIAQNGLLLDRQRPGAAILRRITREYPETVVDSIIGAPEAKLQSNTLLKNIMTIKKAIGKKKHEELGEQLFEKLMQRHQVTGLIKPVSFAKMVDKYKRVLDVMYPPQKVNELKTLAKFGRKVQTAEELAGNPSGTGQTLISWGIFRMIMTNPTTGAILAFTPKQVAKLYTSKFGMKWLTEGFKIKTNTKQSVELFTKLSSIVGVNKKEEQQ